MDDVYTEKAIATQQKRNLLYWGGLLIVIVCGLLMRWIALDERPMHHDESLHAMFGRYFFDFPNDNYYKYDPMMHGPMIYNLLRFVYLSIGCSTWSARALTAVLGSLLIFVPFLFRAKISKQVMFALTAAIAMSPTLIYWARFIREDTLQLFAMCVTLCGVGAVKGRLKAFVVILGITLQFCIKENSFVNLAIIIGYLVFEWGMNWFVVKDRQSMLQNLFKYVRKEWFAVLVAFGLCGFLYSYLLSSGFRHSAGILDGLGRKSVSYWWHQHDIERIVGPFLFHFYMLAWYELLFTVVLGYFSYAFYRYASRSFQITGAIVAVLTIVIAFAYLGKPIQELEPWKFLRVKSVGDIVGCCLILSHSFILTIHHLLRRERALAFWGYFFMANFFTYSYLGEKVPWLTVYLYVPGLIYLILFFEQHFRHLKLTGRGSWEKVFLGLGLVISICGLIFGLEDKNLGGGFQTNWLYLIIGALFFLASYAEGYLKAFGSFDLKVVGFIAFMILNVRQSILINFITAGKPSQYISQVHTTPEFHNFAIKVKELIKVPTDGERITIFGEGDVTWPITWYMIDTPEYKFIANEEEKKNFKYLFIDYKENGPPPPAGYKQLKLSLRGWWLPDFQNMTLKRFLNYSFNLVPWNDTGFTWVTVQVKE